MTATLQGDHDVAGKLGEDIHAALFVRHADVELTYRLDSTNTAVPGL